MKNYIILFAAVLLFSCSSDVTVVTWDDPKSIAVNQHMENYINKDFDAMKDLFTDDFLFFIAIALILAPFDIPQVFLNS